MKKRPFIFLVLLSISNLFFSQEIEHNISAGPQDLINQIEQYKTQILEARSNSDGESEKMLNEMLKKSYSDLQNSTYAALSATQELAFQVLPFDSKDLSWRIIISSELFGSTNLFNQLVDLPWEAVHGTKLDKVEKMSPKEYAEYASHVILYDNMLAGENSILTLRLIYQVKAWNDASEYRFIPKTLEVLRKDYNNQVIYSLESDDFTSASFTISPSVEIRSFAQIEKEREQNEKFVQKELSQYNKKHPSVSTVKLPEQSYKKLENIKSDKKTVVQKGRKSASVVFSDFETAEDLQNFDASKIWLNNISGILTMGFGKFGSVLFEVGGQAKNITSNQYVINLGLGTGLSVNIGNIFRPYAYITEDYLTSNALITRLTGGFDIIFGKLFMLTAAYGYNFSLDIGAYDTNKNFFDNLEQYHSFSVGLGFTWGN